jgi:glycosyltransferase involved in cell wall biosynthesis
VNVLFLDQFSDLGGAQQVLLDTVAAARQRDWKTWAALPPSGPLIDRLRTLDATVVEIPCGPYGSGRKSIQDLLRFRSDVREQARIIGDLQNRASFDLIYVNGPRLLPAAASVSRGPVLFHAHSNVEQSLARKLAGRSIRRAGASVAACSNSVMEQFRSYAAPDRQFVIPNGAAAIEFRERTFARDGKWRIGVIGRISPEKGQAEFVRAAAVLHAEFPGAQFTICGAPLFADSSYLSQVKELASALPVEFPGWREDVAAVLSELDLLIVPSRQEGMGRVVIEAFSAGVPVVACAVGGIPEVVTDRETGFLVRDTTAESLAQCIREVMLGDPAKLRQIAANARRVWERSYTVELYQKRITTLMERLVSDRRSERGTAAPPRRK